MIVNNKFEQRCNSVTSTFLGENSKMKAVLLLCLCIGLNCGMQLRRKTKIPFELSRAMANATSLDSFLRAMSIDLTFISSLKDAVRSLKKGEKLFHSDQEICRAVTRPKECPRNKKDLCTDDSTCSPGLKCCNTGCRKECTRAALGLARFASDSDFPDLPLRILESAKCAPRPVVVEVPQPVEQKALNFPMFVTLHRCGGACRERPFDTKCQAQETQDLNLLVSKLTWSSSSDKLSDISNEITTVRMTNHTQCGCQCIVKPSDCNNRTEEYSEENCRCECKARGMPCPFNFEWNPDECQCTCNPTAESMARCNKRYQFDKKLCRCVCSTKPCKMAVKIRDPRDCRCKCPRKSCPIGMNYDLRTCTCISRVRRN